MYRSTFLFALSLLWDIDVPAVELAPGAAEAAFGLHRCFSGDDMTVDPETARGPAQGAARGPAQGTAKEENEEAEALAEEESLPWEETEEELPRELKLVWSRVVTGKKMDLKEFLDQIPVFNTIPRKALVNNHRLDGSSQMDKTHKSWEQSLLNILRINALVFQGIQSLENHPDQHDLLMITGQSWQYLAEMVKKIQDHRREASIPGSVGSKDEGLFGKEELQQAKLVENVNRRSSRPLGSIELGGNYSFRPSIFSGSSKGGKGWKGQQGKGFKGRGQRWSWGTRKGGGQGVPRDLMAIEATTNKFTIQSQDKSTLVANELSEHGNIENHHTRCVLRLALSQALIEDNTQGPTRNRMLFGNSKGIYGGGGHEKSGLARCQISHSLVHYKEKGRNRFRKKEAHCRLQGIKQISKSKTFQIGQLEPDFPNSKEGNVGGQK
jgi:hypothetical protein